MNSVGSTWRKSTYSREGGSECVEVADLSRGLAVRDSTDPDGPRLAFASIDWDRFLTRVRKAGT